MFIRTCYIYHSRCLKGWPFLPFYFLSSICMYTCLSLGHCYKQIWYFTPLFSHVVVSLGFGLVIRMFFWWRGGPTLFFLFFFLRFSFFSFLFFYALLSSGFVWMLLSLCTLISIVSGLRDSFPFSSFSGSFLWWRKKKNRTQSKQNAQKWDLQHVHSAAFGNYRNLKCTYNLCE